MKVMRGGVPRYDRHCLAALRDSLVANSELQQDIR